MPVHDGEQAAVREIEIRNAMTKPPARYNEATLLAAMEGAGKLVHDEELAAAMSANVMFLIILGFLLLGLLCVVAGILWRRTHPRTSAPEA